MVQFLVFALMAFTVGPLHNEGGAEAVKTKGVKEAASTAWAEREPLDYSKLND